MTKSTKIKRLLAEAMGMVGTRYEYGAYTKKDSGKKPNSVDCSSLIQYIFSVVGVKLPRSTILQAAQGREIKHIKNIEPGDLIFFEGTRGHYSHKKFKGKKVYVGHAAFYVGNGKVIDAEEDRGDVREITLKSITARPFYKIVLIKRYV